MRRIFFNFLLAISGLLILSSSDSSIISNRLLEDRLFTSDSCLHLSISSEFSKILSNTDADTLNHPGKLWYFEKNGDKRIFNIKISIRGHFRRSSENCDFPPLAIEFEPNQVKESIFQNLKSIKLVTHCHSRRNLFEQYLLQEYLIYKLYNLFTDLSYRVRLASISYSDDEKKINTITKYAFFLENTTQLARRCNVERLHIQYIFPRNTDSIHINMLSVFEYLIGNTDWSVPALHNITIVRRKPAGPIYAIPYDFDLSGIINAIYARPQANLGLSSVRERLFRGNCRTAQEFESTFEAFRNKKETIYSLYKNQEGIEKKQLSQALVYLDEFYQIINSPKLIKKEFLDRCRN